MYPIQWNRSRSTSSPPDRLSLGDRGGLRSAGPKPGTVAGPAANSTGVRGGSGPDGSGLCERAATGGWKSFPTGLLALYARPRKHCFLVCPSMLPGLWRAHALWSGGWLDESRVATLPRQPVTVAGARATRVSGSAGSARHSGGRGLWLPREVRDSTSDDSSPQAISRPRSDASTHRDRGWLEVDPGCTSGPMLGRMAGVAAKGVALVSAASTRKVGVRRGSAD
jgi:hypothetical protein